MRHPIVLLGLMSFVLTACGSGDGTNGTDGTNGLNGTNGTNGMSGSNGLSSLLNIVSEPSGANCAAGGNKVTAGLDSNGNGVLDDSEVAATRYVCNGAMGNAGGNGTNGTASLIDLVAEPAGATCAYGGSKVLSGMDTNGNGTLEASEIAVTRYICNGAPGPGVTWTTVTGNAVQAEGNKGYIADSDEQVVVTLPANPSVGDVVQISGLGAGGWRIAQNAGQTIRTASLQGGKIGASWIAHNQPNFWQNVASSADGTKVVAVAVGASGRAFTSTDEGATWTPRDSVRNWISITSSADGNRLFGGTDQDILTSSNGGITWTVTNFGPVIWGDSASSADGTHVAMLFAAVIGPLPILTSADSGATTTLKGPSAYWTSIAMSADGTRLAACDGEDTGAIYTSNNFGDSWTQRGQGLFCYFLAASDDGRKMLMTDKTTLYTSSDGGVTWVSRGAPGGIDRVASSADGIRLFAFRHDGRVLVSTDSGATWTTNDAGTNQPWGTAAISADGMRLLATGYKSAGMFDLYTSSPSPMSTTSAGTGGGISSGRYDTIDLQYVGGGLFIVRGAEGSFAIR